MTSTITHPSRALSPLPAALALSGFRVEILGADDHGYRGVRAVNGTAVVWIPGQAGDTWKITVSRQDAGVTCWAAQLTPAAPVDVVVALALSATHP